MIYENVCHYIHILLSYVVDFNDIIMCYHSINRPTNSFEPFVEIESWNQIKMVELNILNVERCTQGGAPPPAHNAEFLCSRAAQNCLEATSPTCHWGSQYGPHKGGSRLSYVWPQDRCNKTESTEDSLLELLKRYPPPLPPDQILMRWIL